MGACMSTSKKALQSHRAEIEKHARPAMAALQAKVQSNKAESNTTASKEEDTAKADTTKSSTTTSATNANIAETAPSTPKSTHNTTTTIITHSSPSSQHGQLQQQQRGEAPEPAREQKNPYQDALNDALMAQGDRMANHLAENEATLLAPIHGWSLEKYATVQAHIAQNSSLYDKILEKHGITKSEWEAIDQGWQQRMRDDKDTGGVMSQYGKYYMAAGTGDYGTSAKEATNVMNIAGVSTGEAPSAGGETDQVSFDKYLEWIGAQGAWSNLGLDVNAKLKEVFGITAHDYSNVAGYWSMKMMSDMNLAMKMGTDVQKWTAVYMQHPNGPPK